MLRRGTHQSRQTRPSPPIEKPLPHGRGSFNTNSLSVSLQRAPRPDRLGQPVSRENSRRQPHHRVLPMDTPKQKR